MKRVAYYAAILLSFFVFSQVNAQEFNGEWECAYATWDDQVNGTGYNTISVAAVGVDEFAALVTRAGVSYLVGYRNPTDSTGRLGDYEYTPSDYYSLFVNGFDQVSVYDANDLSADKNGIIYVASNDTAGPSGPGRNILTFQLGVDSLESYSKRLPVGEGYLWAIDVDDNGRVYVSSWDEATDQAKVLVFDNFDNEGAWDDPNNTTPTPLQEIVIPDLGEVRGVTVDPSGQLLYISNFDTKKIYCYTGDADNGFALNPAFDFTLEDTWIGTGVRGTDTLYPGPQGLQFLGGNNILFVAAGAGFTTGTGYEYGRIFAVDPNNGRMMDTLDVAKWYFEMGDSSYYRPTTTYPKVSGYTSVFNVDVDSEGNLYGQSYYGWTAEKWEFTGTLPTIPLTIVGVQRESELIPEKFALSQNYPNPFNPTTTIEFSLNESSSVSLTVYSITGEKVADLISTKNMEPGTYSLTFDASKLASGTYIYSLTKGDLQLTKKMQLIK